MLRTNEALLHPREEQEEELRRLAEASARLWNKANYQRRQAFFNNGRTPSHPYHRNYFKDDKGSKILGTCKAQALLLKLAEACPSFLELLQLKKEGCPCTSRRSLHLDTGRTGRHGGSHRRVPSSEMKGIPRIHSRQDVKGEFLKDFLGVVDE
jgi:hypothetical protein